MWKRMITVGISVLTLLGCSLGGETLATEPTAEQRAAMQTPDGTVELYYNLLQQEQYTAVAPLLTDAFRDQLIKEGNGRLSGFYKAGARYSGALESFTIEQPRTLSADRAEVDVTVRYANRTRGGDPSTVELTKSASGWQIARIRNRDA